MLAGADARTFIVMVMTYLIGVGRLSYVVAGSCEAFFAVFNGDATPYDYLSQFFIPTALGNMRGGIGLVTLLSHARVAADQDATD